MHAADRVELGDVEQRESAPPRRGPRSTAPRLRSARAARPRASAPVGSSHTTRRTGSRDRRIQAGRRAPAREAESTSCERTASPPRRPSSGRDGRHGDRRAAAGAGGARGRDRGGAAAGREAVSRASVSEPPAAEVAPAVTHGPQTLGSAAREKRLSRMGGDGLERAGATSRRFRAEPTALPRRASCAGRSRACRATTRRPTMPRPRGGRRSRGRRATWSPALRARSDQSVSSA